MDVIMFPENLLTTSGLSILLHGFISLPDAKSYDNDKNMPLSFDFSYPLWIEMYLPCSLKCKYWYTVGGQKCMFKYRDHTCINICRVWRKLFEHVTDRPSIQTSPEGSGKC